MAHIVITGASSGIGAALACEYAGRGVTLSLLGRDVARLQTVAMRCEEQGATVQMAVVDVQAREEMEATLTAWDNALPVDVVIANAGISAGSGGSGAYAQTMRMVMAVNVDGVLNSILPLIPRMQARKSGQIALMSSLAGIRGLPSAPAYSAAKAAVRFLGEGLRGSLGKDGIKVSVICPGYVKTPLTDANNFPMPFLMPAEEAARRIRKGLQCNTPRIAFPKRLYLPLWLLSCLSPRLTDWFFARLPEKG